MTDDDIIALQKALNERGEDLAVDGVLGTDTVAALRRFQDSEGLQVTGQPSPETLAALGLQAH